MVQRWTAPKPAGFRGREVPAPNWLPPGSGREEAHEEEDDNPPDEPP
jgi:hypothetical protein